MHYTDMTPTPAIARKQLDRVVRSLINAETLLHEIYWDTDSPVFDSQAHIDLDQIDTWLAASRELLRAVIEYQK